MTLVSNNLSVRRSKSVCVCMCARARGGMHVHVGGWAWMYVRAFFIIIKTVIPQVGLSGDCSTCFPTVFSLADNDGKKVMV